MPKIYLNVDENDRHKIRGIPLRLFPDEMDIDPAIKDIAKDLQLGLK